MGIADSKHFLHLVRAAAANPRAGPQAWADASGVPKATAYRLLRPFRFHGAITGMKADPRRVLHLAANLRKDRVVPYTTIFRERYLTAITAPNAKAQLAFQSAANAYGFFEESVKTVRIDPQNRHEILPGITASASLQSDSQWPILESKRRPLAVVYMEDLSRFPQPTRMEDTLVSDPFITYMDLLSHPRAGAHAEFFDAVMVRSGLLPERP